MGNGLTSWRRPHANFSQSPSVAKSEWEKPLAMTVSRYIQAKCTCSSWTSRNGSIGCTTSTRSSERSARNGSTCPAPSARIISCCHSSIRSGCAAKYCRYFGNNYDTQMQVRQLEHDADLKDRENGYPDFLRKQIKLSKVSEKV